MSCNEDYIEFMEQGGVLTYDRDTMLVVLSDAFEKLNKDISSIYKPGTKINILFLESGDASAEIYLLLKIAKEYKIGTIYLLDEHYKNRTYTDMMMYPGLRTAKENTIQLCGYLENLILRGCIEKYELITSYDMLYDKMETINKNTTDDNIIHFILGIHMNTTVFDIRISTRQIRNKMLELYNTMHEQFYRRPPPPIYNYLRQSDNTILKSLIQHSGYLKYKKKYLKHRFQ
jgi:hypothetical protein